MSLEEFVARGQSAQRAVDKLTEPPRQPTVRIWDCRQGAWWKPNQAGYTPHRSHAGLYLLERALELTCCIYGDLPIHVIVPLSENEASPDPDGETLTKPVAMHGRGTR